MEIENLLTELVLTLENNFKDNFTGLVLFGSYAKGTQNKTSDVDLLITFKKLPINRENKQEFISDFLLNFQEKYHIEINAKIAEENKINKTILIYEIADYARIIIDKNKKILKLFEEIKKDYESGFVKKIFRDNYHVIQFV